MTMRFSSLFGRWPAALPALLCGLLAVSLPSSALADAIAEAQRLIKQGQWSPALERVDAHIRSAPRDAQGLFLKGLILSELGRPAEAIAVYTRLVEEHPELPEPYNNLAVLYAQQKQFEKARALLDMAIRTHPGFPTAHENLADVYLKLASQSYEKALRLNPGSKQAKARLATISNVLAVSAGADGKPVSAVRSGGDGAALAVADSARPVAANAMPAVAGEASGKAPPVAVAPSDETGVREALQAWATAWSQKDSKAYFELYAADFRRPGGMSRKAWEAERMQRLARPGKETIEVDDIRVSFAEGRAIARFRQDYRSVSVKSSVVKTFIFVKSGDRWLIQEERSG